MPVFGHQESILVLAGVALELQQAVLAVRVSVDPLAVVVSVDELDLVLAHAEALWHLLRGNRLDRVVERLCA